MLAPDVRFEGWDTVDWLRLLSLFNVPTTGAGAVPVAPGPGGLFVVHDGKQVRKLLHTRVGRLDPAGIGWGRSLAELAEANGAGWVVALQDGALESLLDRLAGRVARHDDLIDQALKAVSIACELSDEGAITSWPTRLRPLPPSTATVLRTGLDALCPPGKVTAVGLFDQGELWTALIIGRGPRGIDRILGPEALRSALGLLSGDFRRDYWHLARAIESSVGKLHIGLFTDVVTLQRLVREGRAGSWARAVAVRDVVLSPVPAALTVSLGVDAARGLAVQARRVAGRLSIDQRLAAAIEAVRSPEQRGSIWQALRKLFSDLSR